MYLKGSHAMGDVRLPAVFAYGRLVSTRSTEKALQDYVPLHSVQVAGIWLFGKQYLCTRLRMSRPDVLAQTARRRRQVAPQF